MAESKPIQAIRTNSLRDYFRGELIKPGDPNYEETRKVWNGMIDRRPAVIARCLDAQDVIAAVNYAREQQMLVAVHGGGHNVAGHATCDGGMMIDLSLMKDIQVDSHARRARAGGGVLWGELDAATQPHGLATPGGVFSKTGIAGLTLGGGYGWLRNKLGLSCDNLVAAEVVTADGRLIRASQDENPDLLWGLRGGGGNFGIVTTFEFQLHQLGPQVMFVFVFHDGRGGKMVEGIRTFRDYCAAAPDEVSALGFCGVFSPGAEMFPVELHGLPFFAIGAMYAGAAEEGERILQPLRDFNPALVDFSAVMPYVDAQKAFDHDYPDGLRYYWKSLNLLSLDDGAIETIALHARQQPSPLSTTDIWHVGGAVKRIGPEHSAFSRRQAAFLLNSEANWEDPADDAANIHWARSFVDAMKPYSDGSRYLNFAGFQEEGHAMMRAAFGEQYGHLAALKARYDPHNFFRLNQNIPPAG